MYEPSLFSAFVFCHIIPLFLEKPFSDSYGFSDHWFNIDSIYVHERVPRVPMYVRNARVHAFNGYLYTNKRTVQYTRAPRVRTHIHLDRQTKGSNVCRTGWEALEEEGEGRKAAKEGEGRRRRQKNTHRRCSVRSVATGTLLSVTNFFSFPSSTSFLPDRGAW